MICATVCPEEGAGFKVRDYVTIDDPETRPVQEPSRPANGSAGAEDYRFIGETYKEARRPSCEHALEEGSRCVVQINENLLDSPPLKHVKTVPEERLAPKRHHRLRSNVA